MFFKKLESSSFFIVKLTQSRSDISQSNKNIVIKILSILISDFLSANIRWQKMQNYWEFSCKKEENHFAYDSKLCKSKNIRRSV